MLKLASQGTEVQQSPTNMDLKLIQRFNNFVLYYWFVNKTNFIQMTAQVYL